MKRWFYILLGGFGLGLSLWAGFMLWLGGPIILSATAYVMPVEISLVVIGIVLAGLGLYNGREAGEFDPRRYNRASQRRDHHVGGSEIDFRCPTCQKVYRASPMLAGKPFMCRECNGRFQVPAVSSIRALPGPTARVA